MGAWAQGRTILIVEDHPVIAAEIADIIQTNGGHVLGPVFQLAEAMHLIETAACDAALLDINLGSETVYPAAEKLQNLGVPFAFITGFAEGEMDSRYADAALLHKPFGEMQVESCLRKLIGDSGQSIDRRGIVLMASDRDNWLP
jgi:two-component SAPR family response regulator